MDFVLHLEQEDLAAFDTLNLNLLFVSILEIQGRQSLELELLRHCLACSTERSGIDETGDDSGQDRALYAKKQMTAFLHSRL